jgi:hypothetical protein
MPFAKPRKVWHFCQFSSSKCQLAQNAKLKCQTIGPLFSVFWQILKCKTHLQTPLDLLLRLTPRELAFRVGICGFLQSPKYKCKV